MDTNPDQLRRRFLQAGALVALGACSPHILGPVGPADEWALADPSVTGLSAAGLEGIREAVQQQIDTNAIFGAVSAVFRHGRLAWFEAQGYRDPAARIPMRPDDIFRFMSSSKPITAVAILMMLEEGRLALDDKVSRFIPEFANPRIAAAPAGANDPAQVTIVPARREITIRDLLTHMSGITSVGDRMTQAGASHLVNRIEKRPDDTLATYIPRLGAAVLDFEPGSRWHYSPLDGIDVLLRIVEICSAMPADRFLSQRLFEPLGMRDTGFSLPANKRERLVGLYGFENGSWRPKQDFLARSPQYFSGAAGLFGTAHDYMQFQRMLLGEGSLNGRRFLRPETVRLMATNQVGTKFADWIPPITGGYGFGLGVRIVEDQAKAGGRSVGSFGWPGAYGTDGWSDPAKDLAAVLFIQVDPLSFVPGKAFGAAVTNAAR